MNDVLPIPSDRDLVAAARDGSEDAWAEFVARHAPAVRAVAAAGGRRAAGRTDRAFADLREELTSETEGDRAVDHPGVRAMRPRAIAALTGGVYGPGPQPELADDDISVTAELPAIAEAFSRLPEAWQTVLWHHYVDHAPAAEQTARLGRSAAATIALRATAERGLFDAYCAVVAHADPLPLAECRPIVPQLGGYRRGTLPSAQARAVTAHLRGGARADPAGTEVSDATPGCAYCRRRLAVADDLDAVLAPAIVPELTGMTVNEYRHVIGATGVLGSSALAARRAERASRRTRAAAVAAVVLALLAAAFFIRAPFEGLQPDLSEIIDEANGSTTTVPETPSTTVPDGPSRIELVFPESPTGAVYVPGGRPLNLSIELATPAPVLAGGTAVLDARITNRDTVAVSTSFQVRVTEAVAFNGLAEGDGSCRLAGDGATCSITVDPGDTVSMSMEFLFGEVGPDRLIVDSGFATPSLDVPVHVVPDLLVGTVERGASAIIGGTLGPCRQTAECPDGTRNASSATLDLPSDADVEMALLVWEGPDPAQTWARGVGLIVPGARQAQSINRSEPEPDATPASASFRSTADVTAAVRAGGAGRYTFVRTADASGPGSWSLVVVSTSPGSPRRLIIVTAPATEATSGNPVEVGLPVAGSATPSGARTADLSVQGWATTTSGSQSVTVNETAVGGADPFGVGDEGSAGGEVRSYDLEIASTEDALSIVASTTDGALRVTVIGVTLDVAS